jgi:hypothetical protein
MQFYRLYAGEDGQSHFEPLDAGRTSEFFNKTPDAKGLLFRNDFAPHIVNYHRAPHRRWVITLASRQRRNRFGRRHSHDFLSRRRISRRGHYRARPYGDAGRLDQSVCGSGAGKSQKSVNRE